MFTIPEPVPDEGYRKLSSREMLQRQRALTCIRSEKSAQCQGQVYATIFFDGTGNNMDWQEPRTTGTQQDRCKHSNVARLFNAAITQPKDGFFPYYIPGVGTPYAKIGDHDGGRALFGSLQAGGSCGYMGADRINWGITCIYNAVHYFLTESPLLSDDQAKVVVNNMSSSLGISAFANAYRRMVLKHWEEKLTAVVKRSQRKITQINVAVLGFSRGAAEARAFANWLTQLLKKDDGGYALAGVPLRIYFMGLFDSVASVGIADLVPGVDGHMAWADGNMDISPAVEQCVHFLALHEQRACFPLEAELNVRHVVYPGMHTDVGGGYLPTEQGKLAQLSQVPLIDMHYEAFKAGVPLLSTDEIKSHPKSSKDFFVPPELITAYNDFWSACGIGAASGAEASRALIRKHTQQYLQWRGGLLERWQNLGTRAFYLRANQKDKEDLSTAQADLAKQVAEIRARLRIASSHSPDLLGALPRTGLYRPFKDDPTQRVDAITLELLAAIDNHAKLPEAVRRFMDDYLHDSRAGFRQIPVHGLEPYWLTGGYLRYRNVYWNEREPMEVASAEAPCPSPGGAPASDSPVELV